MIVPYVNLGAQHKDIKEDILVRISNILDSGQFILGNEVTEFEEKFALLSSTKYAVGVANGTDALFLSLLAIGLTQGDEVITTPNSYLASASSIALAGGTIRFCDVAADFNMNPELLEKAITSKTKAVILVHLTGRPANIERISAICEERNIALIEDCAQAVGAKFNGQPVGSFGITGCFSLHPLKNLSACGDAGIITTNDDKIYKHLLKSRNHGCISRDECEFWSYNSRIDTIQAAILNVKLKELPSWTERRREIAKRYIAGLANLPIALPIETEKEYSVFHTFIIQTEYRNTLQTFLASSGIDTKIHYPISIYKQTAAAGLPYKPGDFPETDRQTDQILSLPVYPELSDEQVDYVIQSINNFFSQNSN